MVKNTRKFGLYEHATTLSIDKYEVKIRLKQDKEEDFS